MALTAPDFTKVEEDTGALRAKMSNKEFFLNIRYFIQNVYLYKSFLRAQKRRVFEKINQPFGLLIYESALCVKSNHIGSLF